MHDRALECSDENFGEFGVSPPEAHQASGKTGAWHRRRSAVSGPATPPGGGFATFMKMRLRDDDAVEDNAKSAASFDRLVRSFERAYVENDVQAMVALCREAADWCDGERLVKGRAKIAEFLKRDWGEQSGRVQRTRVFTSGHNRVAACFEREYVVRVPGDGDERMEEAGAGGDARRRDRAEKYVSRGAEFWDIDDAGFVRARVGIVNQARRVARGETGEFGETALAGSSDSSPE